MTVLATARPTQDALAAGHRPHPFRTVPVLCIAAGFVLLELVVSPRYGFHRDELYFLACARHLAWGYVDQPPLVPAVAWLSIHVLGTSPTSIRVLPALAGGAAVVLVALMAREMGGAWRAQVLAALAAATSPQLLGSFHLLSTTAFDDLFWCGALFVFVRLLRTGQRALWLVLAAIVGIGLENKWNIGFFAVALAVGLLAGGRARMLLEPWAWAGIAIAAFLWVPNLAWNAGHQWAEVSMTHQLHTENGGLGAALTFVPSQIVLVGPVLIVFWVAGLRHLARTPTWKPIAVAYCVLLVAFALSGAKPYYLAGMYYALFAGGGVWAEHRLMSKEPARGVRGWVALMVVGLMVALPLTLPVLPEAAQPSGSWVGGVNKDLSATIGWSQLVAQVAAVAHHLPPAQQAHFVVFTGDYGAAGAIDLYGRADGFPHAISGHNAYWWWGYAGAHDGATTIAVNLPATYLETIFSTVQQAGTVRTPHNVWTEERGDPIFICTGQKVAWSTAWPLAKHYG